MDDIYKLLLSISPYKNQILISLLIIFLGFVIFIILKKLIHSYGVKKHILYNRQLMLERFSLFFIFLITIITVVSF